MSIFFDKYSTVNVFSFTCDFLTSIFFSLAYVIVRILYIIHTSHKYVLIDVRVMGEASSQQ